MNDCACIRTRELEEGEDRYDPSLTVLVCLDCGKIFELEIELESKSWEPDSIF